MRGVGRLILAHRAGLDDDARNAELRDRGQRLRVHVLREHVVFKIRRNASKLELIAHGDDLVHILLRPVVRNFIRLTQVPHQSRRGNVEVIVAVVEELPEIGLPRGAQALHVVFIRPGICHREVTLAFDAELLTHLQKLQNVFIRRAGVGQLVVDDDDVIRCAVRDQHVAVPVQNAAARTLNRRLIGHGVRVRHGALVRAHRRERIHAQQKHAHDGNNHTNEHDHTESRSSCQKSSTCLSNCPCGQVYRRAQKKR